MARPKSTPIVNLDQLVDEAGAPSAPAVDEPQPEAPETEEKNSDSTSELDVLRAELEAARAELAAEAARRTSNHRPIPEEQLTPDQRQIRQLQDELARVNGRKEGAVEYEENVEGGILVHFLEDGVTSNQRVFFRGQEIVFGPEAYEQTKDRFGRSWLEMDDAEQFERWGEVKFRKGPWPGKRAYAEPELATVSITSTAPVVRI